MSSLFFAGLLTLPANAEKEYQPCPNQDAHDFIFLMDKSGSLRKTDPGMNPDWGYEGTQRLEALQKISTQLLDMPDARVGLIEFANEAQITRELLPGELSDSHMRGAAELYTDNLGADTNYKDALGLAKDMFRDAKAENPERCRVLLFFTDGVNDPVGDSEDKFILSIAAANRWVDSGELQELTEDLHNLEVQTIAVILLDDTNNHGLTAIVIDGDDDLGEDELLEISLEALGSITGHCESEIFTKTDLTKSVNCESSERNGSIVAVNNVDNLVNGLLREVNRSAKTVYGCPVDAAEAGDTIYDPMPAGYFIQSIDLYAYDGNIRKVEVAGYELFSGREGHVSLDAEVLENLPSGWVLEIKVDNGSRVVCDAEPVKLLKGFNDAFLFTEDEDTGENVDTRGSVSARQEGDLIIENGIYLCDGIDDVWLEEFDNVGLEDIPWVDDSVLSSFSEYADCGSNGVVNGVAFTWNSLPALEEDSLITSVSGYVTPKNNPSNWPDLPFEANFDPELKVFSIATEPVLRCSGDKISEDSVDVVGTDFSLKSPVCTAQLDEGVNGKIRVLLDVIDVEELDSSEADWGFEVLESSASICVASSNAQEIVSIDSGFCNFLLKTTPKALNEPPKELNQKATITLEWDETEAGVWNYQDEHEYGISLDREGNYRKSTPIVVCNGLSDKPGPNGKAVPEEAIESNISCEVTPPEYGLLELCAIWESESDLTWLPKWNEADENENGCLVVPPGDKPEFTFWSKEPLEDKDWVEITGVIKFVPTWEGGEPLNAPELEFTFDFKIRPDKGLAAWIAVLISILGVLTTYTLLYLAMRIQDRFPSSEDFYFLEHEFEVEIPEDKESFLKAPEILKEYEPKVADLRMLSSNSSNRRRLNVGSFELKARSPAFWNVLKLLTGGWGEVKKEGWVTEILPVSSQKSSATELNLTNATLLSIKPSNPGFTTTAVVAYLVPKTAAENPIFGLDAVKNQKDSDLPTLIERISPNVHTDSTDEPPHTPSSMPGPGSPPPRPDNSSSPEPSSSPPPRTTNPPPRPKPDNSSSPEPRSSPPPRTTNPPPRPKPE
ncbi:MAG: VWA domain-containing protein [Acidimicrobiales bacterium]|nr:VWA domain-containing protein [Acidimicrobiales bacterium]